MSPVENASPLTTLCAVDAMGVDVELRATPALPDAVRTSIRAAWKDCLATGAVPQHRRAIELSPDFFADPAAGLSDLSTRVTLEALDALRGSRLLLHAAGVAQEDGRTIALVGPSGRGKTTASRHLGRHFSYVSDETVAVAEDLSVRAYRKPLSIITEGLVHKEQIAPSDVGLRDLPSRPLHLVGLTLIDREPDADEVGPVVVDTIDAICEMTPQISYLPELPNPLRWLARLFDAVGAPTRLVYRDARELPALVERMFEASPSTPADWALPRRAASSGPWRAGRYDDAILVDGRACILRDGVVTALGELGRLVWVKCLEGASVDAMIAAAISEFGEPGGGDAATLVAGTLDELRSLGFIEVA